MVFPFQLKLPLVAGEVKNADSADTIFIPSLKVTVIWETIGTFVPLGVFTITEGGAVSGTVVNCQIYGEAILLPEISLVPVPTVIVYIVLYERFETGV